MMNLPADFIAYTRRLMGGERFSAVASALADKPTVSIRLNPFKVDLQSAEVPLADGKVAWCRGGYYLKRRPEFTFDPLMHAGAYYVQEASSMFLDHVLRQLVASPVTMLDLCAAPGGKSMVARAALPEGSILFSNEPLRQRAQVLNENMLKMGHPDVVVSNCYARDYASSGMLFDVILTDVPCSGEGMFRKEDGAIADWSMEKVRQCQSLQRQIVSEIWPSLKAGGLLIYSTCTFNDLENEQNAAWIAANLGAEYVDVPIEKAWNIMPSLIDDKPVYRFLPGFTRGEGLFMVVLRKRGTASASAGNNKKNLGKLRILSHGALPDEQKGKRQVPDTSKALSITTAKDAYPSVDVKWREAVAYLRREAVALPEGTPRGVVMLRYKGLPIGFENNIGTRANNLYPQEWRIRSTHIPEKEDILILKKKLQEA